MMLMGFAYPVRYARNAARLPPVTNEAAHRLAREKGVSRPLYALVRGAVTPVLRIWFRMHVSGASYLPKSGAAIVAPKRTPTLSRPPGPSSARAACWRSSRRARGAAIPTSSATPQEAARLVDEMLWPEVEGEFRRLRPAPA
jgi:hypothetical protein